MKSIYKSFLFAKFWKLTSIISLTFNKLMNILNMHFHFNLILLSIFSKIRKILLKMGAIQSTTFFMKLVYWSFELFDILTLNSYLFYYFLLLYMCKKFNIRLVIFHDIFWLDMCWIGGEFSIIIFFGYLLLTIWCWIRLKTRIIYFWSISIFMNITISLLCFIFFFLICFFGFFKKISL